MTSIWSSA